mmetsp:Transcript_72745/g.225022  ORF Transcript_72745/g.225022 Transcript_72745/m.225022 type:complete len:115 (+) Transcript_72745:109-453(+)
MAMQGTRLLTPATAPVPKAPKLPEQKPDLAKARRQEAAFNLTGRATGQYKKSQQEAISQREAAIEASTPDLEYMEAKMRLEKSLHPETVAPCPPLPKEEVILTPLEAALVKALK